MGKRWMRWGMFFFTLVLLAGCASRPFEAWDRADTIRQSIYTAAHCVDWLQTQEIVSNDDYYELNPVLGKHPTHREVDIYMGATLIANWAIAGMLKPEYREIFQYLSITVEVGCAVHNYRIGIRF